MEPKKTPQADIHAKRGVILNIGLAVSMILVICAFKVVMRQQPIHGDPGPPDEVELVYYPPVTVIKHAEAPTALPQPRKPIAAVVNFTTDKTSTARESNNDHYTVDRTDEPAGSDTGVTVEEMPREKMDSVFFIVEAMPEPIGGYEKFMKSLYKELRYPAPARRQGIEGKVFIEFTVNENGELTNFKTLAGIGGGCDEEAIRALKTTKWKPGKQRAKAVKVRLVQQVTFKLSR